MVQLFIRDMGSVEWHCVMWGERVDEVILAHRREREAPGSARGAFCHSRLMAGHDHEYPAVAHRKVLAALIQAATSLTPALKMACHVGITASTDTFYQGQERHRSFSA